MATGAEQPGQAAMPSLTITLTGNDGTVATRGSGFTLQVPRQMSLKVARMYVAEAIGRELKGDVIENALKAIGCK